MYMNGRCFIFTNGIPFRISEALGTVPRTKEIATRVHDLTRKGYEIGHQYKNDYFILNPPYFQIMRLTIALPVLFTFVSAAFVTASPIVSLPPLF